jgi:hypothetical protein
MMWARVVEFMLGCWLAISPFIFQHEDERLWLTDFAAALTVVTLALVSYWPPLHRAHLLLAAFALLLALYGRFANGLDGSHLPGGYQNYIIIGLLLVMFGIVPNHATRPPQGWLTAATGRPR